MVFGLDRGADDRATQSLLTWVKLKREFGDLSALEGHIKSGAWFRAVREFQNFGEHVKKLYERFNTVPIRIRDGTKREQGVSGIELKSFTES
jgi:hypothetical protein